MGSEVHRLCFRDLFERGDLHSTTPGDHLHDNTPPLINSHLHISVFHNISMREDTMRCVAVFTSIRTALALIVCVFMIITKPVQFFIAPIAHFIHNFEPGDSVLSSSNYDDVSGSSYINILMPSVSTELVCNVLLFISLWRQIKILTVPWLLFNIMIILGLGSGVLYLLSNLLDKQTNDESRVLLMIITLNMFLMMAVLHFNSVVKLFMNMTSQRSLSRDDSSSSWTVLNKTQSDSSRLKMMTETDSSRLKMMEQDLKNKKTTETDYLDSSFDSLTYDDIP